ncbi:teneurin-3 [Plakobranchus ocellatus]|uniref:Teneurin-3 n=1 Tax=Plakobranchus ocellatus TaxID=259542 RepID=A0AAV4BCL2_9GAST|nr:teneurin-3 [Plakobranchus ocellatus]
MYRHLAHPVDCLVPDCSGNGQCIYGQCRCFRGYKGGACELQDKINITELCASRCSGNGMYDMKTGSCECFRHFTGINCETEMCRLQCAHGKCKNQRCVCNEGWTGPLCDQRECNHRCELHGKCNNGTCACNEGWNGKYCTIQGCPDSCSGHGTCRRFPEGWRCDCQGEWKGDACHLAMETSCSDDKDNDNDGMKDCMDPDCCSSPDAVCAQSQYCRASPEPKEVLLRSNAPAPTASFLEKMRFLIETNSVQMDAPRNSFNDSQVSVIRGRVVTQEGTPLIGVRVGVVSQPLYGYTLTRSQGYFDILVNGGGSVKLDFLREPFRVQKASVLVPWNQIITMDTVVMYMSAVAVINTGSPDCSSLDTTKSGHKLRPVVLSTWQHTQLGACPQRSTIIPESQVLQESLAIPGTDVHLVYHSSESSGYMSLILIQMTPSTIPSTLSRVHLKVSVQGVTISKMFEADSNLKYTFAWDRLNAYKQKVYGIVTARVQVGYQHLSCSHIYWETRSATLNGYDMTASHIGGWNLDIHHTYNHQEGILHKGDGTNIYLKEKPKKIITILGSGQRRHVNCAGCNGKAKDNSLLSPMALASGLDGSLYVGDYNFIRKLSPDREEIVSILEQRTDTTPYPFYMTLSPVDGRLYIADFMEKKIKRVRTMGPVPNLKSNYDVVAGTGESCTPGEDRCGDDGLAINAKLKYPKGIAISKDGIMYVADGANIRKITREGRITTLIGSQIEVTDWKPPPCDEYIFPANKTRLKWPTSLAINPLDDSLHILDYEIVFKLTNDFKLVTVAGRPENCRQSHSSFLPTGVLTDDEQASSVAEQVSLVSPRDIAFGPHGDLYIVENDKKHINRVRVVTTDGRIHHFAGAKSKCNCQMSTCSCFNPNEALAALALFSDPTSVTVTPDGVVHLSDMANLRVFSVVSELPQLKDRHYEVVAPETQELYIFNRYGQHRHTVNIHTGQYVYNFTYNVFSSYGKLESVSDSANNVIHVTRDFHGKATEILAPSGQTCRLAMDERHRLHKFTSSVGNTTYTFSYTVQTGLLKSKEDSWGNTYLYAYDETGRLLTARQPTGQVTTLTTDISTTGSIVRMATGSRHVSAMATYGSVQSVLHGSTATNVTYLPDGAVVVLFPSNLTVAIETGSHPIMDKENRMHYKRKVIVPGVGVHRLEWRFYLRRGPPRSGPQKPGQRVVQRLGNRMRVGSLNTQHVVHGSLGGEGREKALMINGVNLLTVEYDRRTHTEIVRDKSQRDIITIVYNSEGLPIQFIPASSHHTLNITYNNYGDIVQWQYGNLIETRHYKVPGLVKSMEGDTPGGRVHRFFYRDSNHPTDIFLQSGKQYKIDLDKHGNLQRIMTPFLGYHHFNVLLSLGMRRFFYRPPGFRHSFIEDYDAMGKLLRVIYPSGQRRMIHRYNKHGQRSLTMFDQTLIDLKYHPGVGLLSRAALIARGFYNTLTFTYLSSLIKETTATFPQDNTFVGARFTFGYDGNFRQVDTKLILSNNISCSSKVKYSSDTGKVIEVGSVKIERLTESRHVLTRGDMSTTRLYNKYGHLVDIKMDFKGKTRFSMKIKYDKSGMVQVWRHSIADVAGAGVLASDEVSTQYIYDVDHHLTAVYVMSEIKWEFEYDADGNIHKIISGGKTEHIKFDVGDKIESMGGVIYKFDSDGFMAQRGLDHVSFNSAGQLVSVTRHTEFKFSYFYDALGRLAAQRDRYGRIVQFFYGNTRKKELITHVFNQTTGDLTEFFYDEKGALIGLQRAGHFYHVTCDPSHSPLAVFASDGTLVKKVSYTPLGVRNADSNTNFDLVFGFQGGFYNPQTRLVHFPDRVYDAMLGRFLSPDYGYVLEKLDAVLEDPQILNLYTYRYLVNVHLQHEQYPRLDLAEWLNILGFDIRSLAPDVSYTGDLNPGPQKPDMQLLPAASAFECTFRRDMHNLLTISTVPQSKVTPLQLNKFKKSPAPLSSLFGPGVTISDWQGTALVNIEEGQAQAWAVKLATVLLNGSDILPISFSIHGRDVHYFVRQKFYQAKHDLKELGLHNSDMLVFETGINVSVHRNNMEHSSYGLGPHEETDIRVHGHNTVLNVRYGTSVDREMRRVLKHAKDRAVEHAWSREKYLLMHSLPSLYHWSDAEMEQIRDIGRVMGYVADYIYQPDQFPELADDCNNILFVAEKP